MDGRGHKNVIVAGFVGLAMFASAGCATRGVKPDGGAVGQVIRDSNGQQATVSDAPSHATASTSRVGAPLATSGHLEVWGHTLKNSKFD